MSIAFETMENVFPYWYRERLWRVKSSEKAVLTWDFTAVIHNRTECSETSEGPTYLSRVLHFIIECNSQVNRFNFLPNLKFSEILEDKGCLLP